MEGIVFSSTVVPSLGEHADLLQIIVGVCVTVILFLSVRTLDKIDANQTKLFALIGELQKKVYRLEGAHEVLHGKLHEEEEGK